MIKILVFAGSARRESYNKRLAAVAAKTCREQGAEATLLDLADYPLPVFSQDLEAEKGAPDQAVELKRLVAEHQGLILACPEYNGSITPLLKNTIDWISRRQGDESSAYRGKTAALLSASPGALGGMRGLVHVRAILTDVGVLVMPQQVSVPRAFEAFDDAGSITDEALEGRLRSAVTELVRTTARLL